MIIKLKDLLREQEQRAEANDLDAFLRVLSPALKRNVEKRRKEEYRKHRSEIWKGYVNEALERAGHAMRVL